MFDVTSSLVIPFTAAIFRIPVVLSLLWIGCGSVMAQKAGVRATFTDGQGAPLANATVWLLDSSGQREVRPVMLSDARGEVVFSGLEQGDYLIVARHVGMKELKELIRVPADLLLEHQWILAEGVEELTGIVVTGKTETRVVEEQPVKAAVINTRAVSAQPATLNDLINRTAGVRIRQTGGLGSAPDVSVNGFQGRAIRYFKDGIPLDYLRDGYNISSVPVNMLDRLEVYKGVLPVALGADALGGAVNLVTRKALGNVLNASYEIASFNTHRVSLNGLWVSGSQKWRAGAELFYNHSDNDYKAVVKVTDPDTRNQVDARLRMFHNAFTSYYAEVYTAISDVGWADELRISLGGFSLQRQQQHPALMTDPYGAIKGRQGSVVPTIRYKKTLFDQKAEVDQFLVYNTVNIGRTDTLRGRYDWYGNFTPNPAQFGESRQPALSAIDFTNFTSRTNVRYQLAPRSKLELNYVVTAVSRVGRDPYGPRFEGTGTDVLSVRTRYDKRVLGIGLENTWLDGKFTSNLMGKLYSYRSAGTDTWAARPVAESERIIKSGTYWGIAEALKYELDANSFVRFSIEAANRLPQQDELFGDGIWIVPNFNLNAERSTNLNAGYRLQRKGKFAFETNAFYRYTKGLILLIPIQPPYAQYTNMENVKGYGIEADGTVWFLKHFSANTNFTYQNLRLFGISSQLDSWKNDTRLRNTPWFFANIGLNADFDNVAAKGNPLKVYLFYNIMKEYYLETIPKRLESSQLLGLIGSANVSSNLIIPTQHLLSAGLTYGFSAWQIGLEMKNMMNADLYDYYRIQKAGRSVHLKVGVSLQ